MIDKPTESDLARDAGADYAVLGPWGCPLGWERLSRWAEAALGAWIRRHEALRLAIVEHHEQKADDRCFLDDDKLYAAAGLPPCDRRVGDKAAMLRNCERFIANRCEGGHWPTYAELEAEVARLSEIVAVGIDESIGKAPLRPADGGFQIEHWAVRSMVASFGETLGDAPNYVEIDVHDAERNGWFIVAVQRKNGKSAHQLRREAEEEAERLKADVLRLQAELRTYRPDLGNPYAEDSR